MKKVVIVGASSGIGYAVAEALAAGGVKVGLGARHTGRLRELQERYPGMVEYEEIDITHPWAPERLHALVERLGGMDIYFHVAGIGYDNPSLDPEREVDIINTNAAGFARMLSAAYNYFREKWKSGQIAAVTSVAGTNGMGRLSAYSSSKKFDQTYMVALEQLAHEENVDIAFTDIRPGWVKTPLLKEGAVYPMEMSLRYVLPQVLKAIVRKKRVAVIDWRWNIVVGLWRLVPDFIWTRLHLPVDGPVKKP